MAITLTVETPAVLEVLKEAVEMAFEIENDTTLDELFYTADQIRTLATKSDDEIKATLTEIRNVTNVRFNRVLDLYTLKLQLNGK